MELVEAVDVAADHETAVTTVPHGSDGWNVTSRGNVSTVWWEWLLR